MKIAKTYPALFEVPSNEPPLETGQRHVENALSILQVRLEAGLSLRTLPLTKSQREEGYRYALKFLRANNSGPFERDNLSHVGRLIAKMEKAGPSLQEFLGVSADDAKLLAALHDLGKSKVSDSMYTYLRAVFGDDDFVSLRVLPHELYSMVWIQDLAKQLGFPESLAHLLMDQIANHNLGPDLADAKNARLWKKEPDGTPKHWWAFHWKQWAEKLRAHHPNLPVTYGHTLSPLANTLVMFDRVDGAEPQAWEKFLNQNWLSGQLDRSAEGIIKVIEISLAAAHEQLLTLGSQLHASFLPEKQSEPLEAFAPYQEAIELVGKNRKVIDRLNASNHPKHFSRFNVAPKDSLLYEAPDQKWFRIEVPERGGRAHKLQWNDGAWRKIDEAETPFELLFGMLH